MAHTFVRNHVHMVFGTRERRPFIKPAIEEKLWAYIRGIARNYEMDLHAIGGMPDHIHLLVAIPAKLSVADAVRVVKANSSKWMNESGHLFGWQKGYAAVSVSASNLSVVMDYINQE
jgi:REP element-mobilizing transposase RayT